MLFEAIFFDCDGVLVDSEHITNRALHTMLNASGWAISEAECLQIFIGKTVRSETARIERETGPCAHSARAADKPQSIRLTLSVLTGVVCCVVLLGVTECHCD